MDFAGYSATELFCAALVKKTVALGTLDGNRAYIPSEADHATVDSVTTSLHRREQPRNQGNWHSEDGHLTKTQWDTLRPRITQFYANQTIPEVVRTIRAENPEPRPSIKSCKDHIAKWKLNTKHLKKQTVFAILQIRAERQAVGKKSSFRNKGRIIPEAQITQHVKRNKLSKVKRESWNSCNVQMIPEGLEVFTPLPSPKYFSSASESSLGLCLQAFKDYIAVLRQPQLYDSNLEASAIDSRRQSCQLFKDVYPLKLPFKVDEYEEELLDSLVTYTQLFIESDDICFFWVALMDLSECKRITLVRYLVSYIGDMASASLPSGHPFVYAVRYLPNVASHSHEFEIFCNSITDTISQGLEFYSRTEMLTSYTSLIFCSESSTNELFFAQSHLTKTQALYDCNEGLATLALHLVYGR